MQPQCVEVEVTMGAGFRIFCVMVPLFTPETCSDL